MSSLLLFSLSTACGTLVVDVEADKDSGVVPDTADTSGAIDSGDSADTDTDSGTGLSGRWTPGLATTVVTAGSVDEALKGLWASDVTGDGNVDLVLGRWLLVEEQNFRAEVWPGDGHGGFASPSMALGRMSVANPSGPNVGDVNGDGLLDMITSWDTGFGVFLGNGRGGFDAQLTYDLGWMYGQHAGVADLNGDGCDDVIVSGGTASGYRTLEIYSYDAGAPTLLNDFGYLGELGFNFNGEQVIPAIIDSTGIASGIWADAFFTDTDDIAFHVDRDHISDDILPYYLGTRLSDDGIRSGAAADLTGDGLDEVVSGGEDGMQVFDPATGVATVLHTDGDWGRPTAGIAIGDLNGDGADDALEYGVGQIVGSQYLGRFAVSLSRAGALRAAAEQELATEAAPGIAQSAAISDLNGDGCGDVLVITGQSAVSVILGDCGA